jgi:hypothetical protein
MRVGGEINLRHDREVDERSELMGAQIVHPLSIKQRFDLKGKSGYQRWA